MSTHDSQILTYFAAQVNRKIADDVLFVVYTERRNRIRIISARLANDMERRKYYDCHFDA